MDRLVCLVFSFYREESELTLLEPLRRCSMRWIGSTVCIDCLNQKHFDAVAPLLKLVGLPLSQLGIGRSLALYCPASIQREGYSIDLPSPSDIRS